MHRNAASRAIARLDALGAALDVRTVPAPVVLNGAPEALAPLHCLVARRVEVLTAEIDRQQGTDQP